MTYYLTLEDFTELARAVLAREGEKLLIRDVGLLQSALARPRMTVFGEDAYASLPRKAAALMESIARNHCLVDGNKRLAWSASKLFLMLNDVHLKVPGVQAAETFVVGVASGLIDLDSGSDTIAAWCVPLAAEQGG
ncbi:MAG: type II toxin-antitoxin system death-on-curing family toxin [Jatrophihabitantaceae bacterium]